MSHIKTKISKKIARLKFLSQMFEWLYDLRFFHSSIMGVLGVGVHLLVTFIFTEYILGTEKRAIAYAIGAFFGVTINFILHTKYTYKTRKNHTVRYIVYLVYIAGLSILQSFTFGFLTKEFAHIHYLILSVFVIGFFALINLFISRFILFYERPNQFK